jgi:hypothetical protein
MILNIKTYEDNFGKLTLWNILIEYLFNLVIATYTG